MKALVTGISGFLGSHLCEHLLACGDEVLGVARAEGTRNPAHVNAQRVETVAWNLAVDDRPSAAAERRICEFAPEVVFHLAAISVPRHCGTSAQPNAASWNTNVRGTERVLALMRRLSQPKRLIFASSGVVYARPQTSFLLAETAALQAHNAYAATKIAAEQAVRAAVVAGEVDAVIVRSFQHAGPRQSGELMMAEWARQFADPACQKVLVHSCDVLVDVSDVRDACRGYRLLALRGVSGETYNLGSGAQQRTGDMLASMAAMALRPKAIVESHPGLRRGPIAELRKLQSVIDWYPRIPITQTLADTLAWWQARAADGSLA